MHRQKYSSQSMNEKRPTDEAKAAFETIANPTAVHLGFVKQVINEVPDDINRAAQSVFGALNVIWAILLCFQEKIAVQELSSQDLISLSDKKEIEAHRVFVKANFHTRSALLSLSLSSLMVMPLYERRKIKVKLQKTQYIQAVSSLTILHRPLGAIEMPTLEDLVSTIAELQQLSFSEKRKLIRTLFQVTNVTDIAESEVLRFLCALLKVPVPPILVASKVEGVG